MGVLNEKKDGKSVFTEFMGSPAPFSEEEIANSATRDFLRKLDLPLIPDFLEEKIDNQIVELLAKQSGLRHVFSFIERGGWFSADAFVTWMQRKLNEGEFNSVPRNFGDMTLAELRAATGIDLSLVASDTTDTHILVLNYRTAPNCPVVWAVRMSMSIPLLWQEVIWQESWGLYRERDITGHAIVDGGMLSNFAIELFVSNLPSVTNVMGEKVSERVLGFLIEDEMPVPGAEPVSAQAVVDEDKINVGGLKTLQRLGHLVNTMLQAHDKMVIEAFERFVVHLPAGGYGTVEFDMSDERRNLLITAGRDAMETYFAAQPSEEMVSFSIPGADVDAEALETANRIAGSLLK
jgi:predicted acylesterase/phospholipase RssA